MGKCGVAEKTHLKLKQKQILKKLLIWFKQIPNLLIGSRARQSSRKQFFAFTGRPRR
jgi:hypothetical protein